MDLCHLPVHELVRLMTTGSVSCREVMRAHLAHKKLFGGWPPPPLWV